MVVTNVLGLVFTASLLSASDTGVMFVFPEDGATNALAWTQLSPASRASVRDQTGFVPTPPRLVPTWQMAERELKRLRVLVARGQLTPEAAAKRRSALRAFLVSTSREHGLSSADLKCLLRRLEGL